METINSRKITGMQRLTAIFTFREAIIIMATASLSGNAEHYKLNIKGRGTNRHLGIYWLFC